MTSHSIVTERFARIICAFEPYAEEVVYVGGWAQTLYLHEANVAGPTVQTTDIDLSLPRRLDADARPPLVELARSAGFGEDPMSELDGASIRLVYDGPDTVFVDLDFLTEGERAGTPISIEGQHGLSAQGYPGQAVLLDNARWIKVDSRLHELLEPARRIRVPRIGAYVLQKVVASTTRRVEQKAAKDLVYVYELVRRSELWPSIRQDIAELAPRYPDALTIWRERLTEAANPGHLRRSIGRQLIDGGQTYSTLPDVEAMIAARFQRVLAETTGNSP